MAYGGEFSMGGEIFPPVCVPSGYSSRINQRKAAISSLPVGGKILNAALRMKGSNLCELPKTAMKTLFQELGCGMKNIDMENSDLTSAVTIAEKKSSHIGIPRDSRPDREHRRNQVDQRSVANSKSKSQSTRSKNRENCYSAATRSN